MTSAERTDLIPPGRPGIELSNAGSAMSELLLTTSVASVALVAAVATAATEVVRRTLGGMLAMLADCASPVAGSVMAGVGGTRLLPSNEMLTPKADPDTASGPEAAKAVDESISTKEPMVPPTSTTAALASRANEYLARMVENGERSRILIFRILQPGRATRSHRPSS